MAKNVIRELFIKKAMSEILKKQYEIAKKTMKNFAELAANDESGMAAIKTSAGRKPTFNSYAAKCQDGTYVSIDTEALFLKQPDLFWSLVKDFPTEHKEDGAPSVSVSCTQKCYAAAADRLDISAEELDNIQRTAKELGVKI